MKMLVLLGLIGALITGSVGTAGSTAACTHEYTTTLPAGSSFHHGYNHTYTTSGGTKSCAVTVYYVYNKEECNSCQFVLQTYKVGKISVHSNPNHD